MRFAHNTLMRPTSEINTPKGDDEHPVPFHMEVPPSPHLPARGNVDVFPTFSLVIPDFDILHKVSFFSYRLFIILALKQSTYDE